MRHATLTLLVALLLIVAARAAAGAPAGMITAPRDHRDLRPYIHEIADDRRALDRLRARLDRLDALLSARLLDLRAVGELHARVQEEMLREAKLRRLRTVPTLGAAGRAVSPQPQTRPPGSASPGTPRFFSAADESRVDQITEEWAALRGHQTRADAEARRKLLAERVSLARFELADDLRIFKQLGGDYSSIASDPEAEDDGEEPGRGP